MSKGKIINLNDRLVLKDNLLKPTTFRTSVDAFNEFGEVIFTRAQNDTVLGGAIFVLEKLANVRSTLEVATLNQIMEINQSMVPISGVYPKELGIAAWGIGIGGSGDTIGSVKPVKFYEREIGSNNHSNEMVPFRVVDTPFTGPEAAMYYGAKKGVDNKISYYLKNFETAPAIRVLWKDGAEGEDGTDVDNNVYNTNRTEAIEVFIEYILKLTKKDVREYFQKIGQIEMCRVNSIALCTGIKKEIIPGTFDYTDARMFSKLNFGNELLENNKEVTFRYRIYTN